MPSSRSNDGKTSNRPLSAKRPSFGRPKKQELVILNTFSKQSVKDAKKKQKDAALAEKLGKQHAKVSELPFFAGKQAIYAGKAFCIMDVNNPVRKLFIKIAEFPAFDQLVLFLILLNCGFMASSNPLDPPDSPRNQILEMADLGFTVCFAGEFIVKVMALGFIGHHHAYLRNLWNWLDFVVVVSSLLPFLMGPGAANFSAIRSFRVLRPLKTVTRIPGMAVLVKALLNAIPNMSNVAALCAFIFLIFGIVGVQLFAGCLHRRCSLTPDGDMLGDGDICSHDEYMLESFNSGRDWAAEYPDWNGQMAGRMCPDGQYCNYYDSNPNNGINTFDSIPYAFVTIFQCISLEGWVDTMYMVQAGNGDGVAIFYFIMLTLLGSFFVINLFLAVIFDSFAAATEEAEMKKMEEQKEAKAELEEHRRRVEAGEEDETIRDPNAGLARKVPGWRKPLLQLAESQGFGKLIVYVIMANTAFMGSEYHNQPESLTQMFETANTVFSLIFFFEMIVKLVGLTPCIYIKDAWNVFDGIIVFFSMFEMMVALLEVEMFSMSVLRSFRLLRVLKLVKAFPGLRAIIATVTESLGQISNLFMLILLVMFIFSLLGMQTFGGQFTEETGFPDGPPPFHFDSFGFSMVTIFIVLSGENWNAVYFECMGAVGDIATLYFLVLFVLGNYVVLNLFVAILLGNFEGAEAPGSSTSRSEKRGESWFERNSKRDRSFAIFSETNGFRVGCSTLVTNPWFDKVIMCLIIISSVALALDHPKLEEGSTLKLVLDGMTNSFNIIFTLEMLSKMVAFGVLFSPRGYLKTGWNILDCFIVIISLIVWAATVVPELAALKTLRALRTLRPLRMLSRNPGLKMVVNSLFKAIPAVGNVLVVTILFLLIFGILGMQMFSGRFGSCSDSDIDRKIDCHGLWNMTDDTGETEELERYWANPNVGHFDHLPAAMLCLFEMAGLEMWPDVMYIAVDSNEKDHGPIREANPIAPLYFILWILVGAFFILNLFVGVVIDNFNKIREEEEKSGFLSDDQKKWVDSMKMIMGYRARKRPTRPRGALRNKFYNLVVSDSFDIFIMSWIIINVGFMAADSYKRTEQQDLVLTLGNYVFTVVFILEMIFKMLGLGFYQYFINHWCQFDFFLVLGSILDFVVKAMDGSIPFDPMILKTVRVFRIARILRLIKSAKGIKSLLETLITSLPSLVNVGTLLLLMLFIFAVTGVNLFHNVAHGEFLFEYSNFENLGNALITLFRCATGESWNGLMHDLSVSPYPDPNACSYDLDDRGFHTCGTPIAMPFFIIFVLLGAFVFLNLIIAVILENFSASSGEEELTVSPDMLEHFQDVWEFFDPKGTNFIPSSMLRYLICLLDEPLGLRWDEKLSKLKILMALQSLDITSVNNQVEFKECLTAMGKRAAMVQLHTTTTDFLSGVMHTKSRNARVPEGQVLTISEMWAGNMLMMAWRRHQKMVKMKAEKERLGEAGRKKKNKEYAVQYKEPKKKKRHKVATLAENGNVKPEKKKRKPKSAHGESKETSVSTRKQSRSSRED